MNFKTAFYILIYLYSTQALAGQNWHKLIECRTNFEDCGFSSIEVWPNNESRQISKDTLESLIQVSLRQTQIWSDTILEGDYQILGRPQLNLVEKIYFRSVFIAYRISYSDQAWYTGDCDYDSENPEKLEKCTSGEIKESSFVSKDFNEIEIDPKAYAEFF